MKVSLVVCIAVLGLSACSAVPLATAMRLGALDPLSADPAGMAVVLELPEGLGIEEGTAQLSLRARAADGAEVSGRYALEQGTDGAWRVRAGDRARLRADQARAADWERADPEGTEGQFSVSLGPCRTGDAPIAEGRVSASFQLEPGAPFLPLLRNVPVADVAETAGIAALPACGAGRDGNGPGY